MKIKKLVALVLATTVFFCNSALVFAATEETGDAVEGVSTYEGDKIEKDTISLTLPTISAGTYDYIADPNNLLSAKDARIAAEKITGGNEGILFQYKAGEYGKDSEEIEVESKSAVAVDVSVKLEVKGTYEGVVGFNDDKAAFTEDNKNKEMYLAVVNNSGAEPDAKAIKSGETSVINTATVEGVPANFELTYADSKYSYKEIANPADYNTAKFKLTGALNKNAEWTGVAEQGLPTIQVTWSYAKHSDAPTSYLSAAAVSASSNSINVTLPTGVTVTSVELTKSNGTKVNLVSGTSYTVSGSTYTFPANNLTNWAGGTIKFTYSDEHTDVIDIN